MTAGTWRVLAEPTYGVGAMGPERGQAVCIPAGAVALVQRDQDGRVEIDRLPSSVILAAFLTEDEECPVTNWFVTGSALVFEEGA